MKKAIVTGVSGQDGSFLSELLLSKGYMVYGINRRKSNGWIPNLHDVLKNKKFRLIDCDLLESCHLQQIINDVRPDEFYNLASQSFVYSSWNTPVTTCQVNAMSVVNILEMLHRFSPKTKFYQASSSEQFGLAKETPQDENTPFHPRSPYACSKVFGFDVTRNYRESYGMFCCNGILFNHESERRGIEFVTRKITYTVAEILQSVKDILVLGNLNAKRDWGYAPDYVEAMWMMMQHETPDDFVIATGENHTVREFAEKTFGFYDMDIVWKGKGVNETGYYNGGKIVGVSPEFYRPADVNILLGNATKAKTVLGWKPKHSFNDLVNIMARHDYEYVRETNSVGE